MALSKSDRPSKDKEIRERNIKTKHIIIEMLNSAESTNIIIILKSCCYLLFDGSLEDRVKRVKPSLVILERNNSIIVDFVYHYIQNSPLNDIPKDSIVYFTLFVAKVLNSPEISAYLVLLPILDKFTKHLNTSHATKDWRELLSLSTKLFDKLCSIVHISHKDSELAVSIASLTKDSNAAQIDEVNPKEGTENKSLNLSVQALALMASHLAPLLATLYQGRSRESLNVVTSSIVLNVLPLSRYRPNSLDLTYQAARLFHSLSRMRPVNDGKTTIPTWKRDILSIFYENDFFKMDERKLKVWALILNKIVQKDPSVFTEFITSKLSYAISHPTATNFFSQRPEEDLNRANQLKRLAFFLYCGDNDQYEDYMTLIQEKLIDALKIKAELPTVILFKQNVFLVLRTILARTTKKKVDSFWSAILTEMMALLDKPIPELTLAVVKFLDFTLVLRNEQFNIWEWIFLTDTKLAIEDKSEPKKQIQNAFVPYLERIAPNEGKDRTYKPIKQKPLIPFRELSKEISYETFLNHLKNFGSLSYQNCVSCSEPDYTFIDNSILKDLCESTPSMNEE